MKLVRTLLVVVIVLDDELFLDESCGFFSLPPPLLVLLLEDPPDLPSLDQEPLPLLDARLLVFIHFRERVDGALFLICADVHLANESSQERVFDRVTRFKVGTVVVVPRLEDRQVAMCFFECLASRSVVSVRIRSVDRIATHLLVDGFSRPLRCRDEAALFFILALLVLGAFFILGLTREGIGILASVAPASEQVVGLTRRIGVESEDVLELSADVQLPVSLKGTCSEESETELTSSIVNASPFFEAEVASSSYVTPRAL